MTPRPATPPAVEPGTVTADTLRAAEHALRNADQERDTRLAERNAQVAQALAAGWTHHQIATATGLTRGRIGQLATRNPGRASLSERALEDAVLDRIARLGPGPTLRDIAAVLCVPCAAVRRALHSLDARGLVVVSTHTSEGRTEVFYTVPRDA